MTVMLSMAMAARAPALSKCFQAAATVLPKPVNNAMITTISMVMVVAFVCSIAAAMRYCRSHKVRNAMTAIFSMTMAARAPALDKFCLVAAMVLPKPVNNAMITIISTVMVVAFVCSIAAVMRYCRSHKVSNAMTVILLMVMAARALALSKCCLAAATASLRLVNNAMITMKP